MNGHHQSEMSEALRIAVERGHIERVVDLLKRGAPSGAFFLSSQKIIRNFQEKDFFKKGWQVFQFVKFSDTLQTTEAVLPSFSRMEVRLKILEH